MRVEPVAALVGHVAVPGDKSISHRAVLVGAIAEGETRIVGFGRSSDTESTIRQCAQSASRFSTTTSTRSVCAAGASPGSTSPPRRSSAGNAGTLMRMLPGILAGQSGRQFELVGDESLRPPDGAGGRAAETDAAVRTTDGHAPLAVDGAELHAIDYELPCRPRRSSPPSSSRALRRRRDDRRRAAPDAGPHRAPPRTRGCDGPAARDERQRPEGQPAGPRLGRDPGRPSSAAPSWEP